MKRRLLLLATLLAVAIGSWNVDSSLCFKRRRGFLRRHAQRHVRCCVRYRHRCRPTVCGPARDADLPAPPKLNPLPPPLPELEPLPDLGHSAQPSERALVTYRQPLRVARP